MASCSPCLPDLSRRRKNHAPSSWPGSGRC